jgi:hypothetical protein
MGRLLKSVSGKIYVWLVFVAGLYLIVIRPLGAGLLLVPGDLGDARLCMYLLEHFYRWMVGLDSSFWNAAFFYPYNLTVAFSDSFLGEGPFYAIFRLAGLHPYAAYQSFYILGFFCNYAASAYVLSRLGFKPWAVGIGAFLFTFDLPILAQENHTQLLYRFAVPLACFYLWSFYQNPKLGKLILFLFFLTLQFYFSIYLGLFLAMLSAALAIFHPLFAGDGAWKEKLFVWPKNLIKAWVEAGFLERVLSVLSAAFVAAALVFLFKPYMDVVRIYGFDRNWSDILGFLPTPQSYLIADRSALWGWLSRGFMGVSQRQEQQLFIGMAAWILVIAGVLGRFPSDQGRLAWANLAAAFFLILLTLKVGGFSLYDVFQAVPGFNSIRAVGRIELVLLWPVSVFIAWTIHSISIGKARSKGWMIFASLASVLLILEPVFYQHVTYNKVEAENRLERLRQQIPPNLPMGPILFVAVTDKEKDRYQELDAMLVAQQLGWPTLNGYSGNVVPGSQLLPRTCDQAPKRIIQYMRFVKNIDQSFYLSLIRRVVPVGFTDCKPQWWNAMP